MSPIETKRTTAIKVADALNSIEGVPVSAFAKGAFRKMGKRRNYRCRYEGCSYSKT